MQSMTQQRPSLSPDQEDLKQGVIAAVIAYTFWGFFPIYFKVAHMIPATEMLAQRIVWSLPFGALIIALRKQGPALWQAMKTPGTMIMLSAAALVIAVNWGVYIWAVQQGRIFEASLGYYINPLIYVLVGVVFWHERLRPKQIFAVALAFIGVGILTLYGGVFPVISFTLAISFTLYGVIRKKVVIGAMPGLMIEIILLFPFALGFLIWLTQTSNPAFESDLGVLGIAMLAGPFTVLPLLFFAIGARRLPLSLLGFLQFIGPSLQFICALYFGEKLTLAYGFCFACIWIAVAVFSFDQWRASHPVVRRPI